MTNLNELATEIFEANAAKGFWDRPRDLTETTMLIITELAEAVEEERAGRPSVWYNDLENGQDVSARDAYQATEGLVYHADDFEEGAGPIAPPLKPEGVDVELVDSLIRLLDLLGSRETDVEGLLKQKLAFNAQRPARHGKAY